MAQTVQFVTKGQRSGLYLTDYNDLIRELNRVQPSLINQMKKDYRKIAKPVQTAVKSGIKSEPPTTGRHVSRPQNTASGFIPLVIPGRLTWGANSQNKNKRVDSVLIKTPSEKKAKRIYSRNGTDAASVARLQVDNAAVVMADMARKTGKSRMTREYPYSGSRTGTRRHKVNGQGTGMIRALNKHGTASRFVWPAAETALPKAKEESKIVLNKAITAINRRMVV